MLLAGAGGAQAILVAASPLLSRLFSPAQFAGLALMTATVSLISRVSSFKFETAIATGRNKPEMGGLAALATWVLLGFTFGAALLPALFFPLLKARFGSWEAVSFCLFLPVIVLFDGLIQIVITWSVRWREFRTVSTNDLLRNGSSSLVQAGAGLGGFVSGGLMLGQTLGTMLAFWVLARRKSSQELFRLASRSSWHRRRVIARRYIDFPLFQMPKAVLYSIGQNVPTMLLAAMYSANATGLYYFAYKFTALPAQLLSQSFGRVLLQRFANLHNVERRSILPLLVRSSAAFTVMALPIVATMMLFGRLIFELVLGQRWAEAGELAAWTSLWSAGVIGATPAQMAMTLLRQNRVMLVLELIFLPLRLLPFAFFAGSNNVHAALAVSCTATILYSAAVIVTACQRAAVAGGTLSAATDAQNAPASPKPGV